MTHGTSSMAENTSHTAEIDATVRRAASHWSRSGIPGSTRHRKAEELRDHLAEAVADGRQVSDVVGSDVVAFAAEWAQADRQRNWVEPVLFLLANLTIWLGLLALLGPVIEDRDSFGMPADLALTMELAMLLVFAVWLVRWFRAQVPKRVAFVLYGLASASYFVSILVLVPRVAWLDRDLEMPLVVVVALVGVGLSSQAVLSWMKRANRL